MRGDVRSRHVLWLMVGLLVALGVSAVASDETFCVMQHTGFFNLTGGQTLVFWNGTGGSGTEPEFAFITVTVIGLVKTCTSGGACLTGGAGVDPAPGGAPSITVTWMDMSERQTSSGPVTLWGNSYTFYAKWARISGTGQGFYTITFNPCGTE